MVNTRKSTVTTKNSIPHPTTIEKVEGGKEEKGNK